MTKWETAGIERIQGNCGWFFGFVRICGSIIFRLKSEIANMWTNKVVSQRVYDNLSNGCESFSCEDGMRGAENIQNVSTEAIRPGLASHHLKDPSDEKFR
jgi:hypothetical protein